MYSFHYQCIRTYVVELPAKMCQLSEICGDCFENCCFLAVKFSQCKGVPVVASNGGVFAAIFFLRFLLLSLDYESLSVSLHGPIRGIVSPNELWQKRSWPRYFLLFMYRDKYSFFYCNFFYWRPRLLFGNISLNALSGISTNGKSISN